MLSAIPVVYWLSVGVLAAIAYATASKAASRAFTGALYFGAIGPPIGFVTFLTAFASSTETNFHIIHVLIMFVPGIIGAYYIGLVPAGLVGAVVGALSIRFGPLLSCMLASMLGVVLAIALAGKWSHGFYEALAMIRLVDLLPSVVASAISTVLFYVSVVRTNFDILDRVKNERPVA
ncbi:MAG: hypothetical protein Q7T08_12890 [Devosia sp.]|nr:hypothetical protein [Devosia sp.]